MAEQITINREIYDHADVENHRVETGEGLTEEVVRKISSEKKEPTWMLQKRLKALELFNGDEEIYKLLSRAYALNKQLIRARVILKDGLTHVSNILSLQRELINLVKVDNDFVSGHHFANQLKLNERTKAEGYMLQGNLFLMENKMSEAINAYQRAAKSGASQEAVLIGLKNAHLLKVSASQRVVKIFHEN